MRRPILALLLLVVASLSQGAVSVTSPKELHAAIDRALADPSASREIVLKAGDYFLTCPILLKGSAASNFTIRAERPGVARLFGGVPLTGWKPEPGTPFWVASVPGWRPGLSTPFRSLLKGDEWASIATYPGGTNRLSHLGEFAPKMMSSLAGGWSRKPTHEEYVRMPYRVEDLPDAMALENADIRLYHMWNDSVCTVSNIDRKAHVLWVDPQPCWAMGAANRRQYEVLNVREGMREPGEWYLDRRSGQVHYWPKPGEDLVRIRFVAPTLKHVIRIDGGSPYNRRDWVHGITIEGLVISACAPFTTERASFGGSGISAAVSAVGVVDLTLRDVVIRNVGGAGLVVDGSEGTRVADCDIIRTGARGVGLVGCVGGSVERNRIADVGLVHRASCGMNANGSNTLYAANEICRVPYCGIIGGGSDNLYVSNYIHHVMQVLHDGAAIYGNLTRCVLRGNVVHDIAANGPGFGVHAYYADEGSRDCVIESNFAEGVSSPVLNHMTLRTVVRGNTFVNHGDMCISFARSIMGAFSNNVLVCDGKLSLNCPDGVPHWGGNFAVRPSDPTNALSRRVIGEWRVERPPQSWGKPCQPCERVQRPPKLDGVFETGEWPVNWLTLDRTPDRHLSGFSTANVRFSWDDDCLYASMMTANFKHSSMRFGDRWGVDDGVELSFVNGLRLRAFFGGGTEVLPASAAEKGVRIWAGRDPGINLRHTWFNPNIGHYEFAIPWAALGIKPKAKDDIRFVAVAFVSEFGQFKYWEGALPGSDAKPFGTLRLKP